MLLLKIGILLCWVVEKECCRIKEFSIPIKGKLLSGHVIKTLFVTEDETCKLHCYLNDICQSINISPRLDNGMWRCELSDTDDKQNPESFEQAVDYKYFSTKNPCSSSPCVKNSTCRPNFLGDNSFQCICPQGFTGSECNTGNKGYTAHHTASSCADVLFNTPKSKSGAYYLKTEEGGVAHTYCHMDEIPECGGGGWTLVMKIDGKKTTFPYHAKYWSNKAAYSQSSGKTFDLEETKMPSYWSNPFTKLCLGMRVGEVTKWVSINQTAVSLYALLENDIYKETNIGKEKWKSLLDGSSLQTNCNKEGFNVVSPTGTRDPAITRIGIISNNEDNCDSCNSRIGFGSAGRRGGQHDDNSCGNEAHRSPDNGEKHIKANCYILVQ